MLISAVRRFLTNIICAFVYNQEHRKKLRVILNSPVLTYLRFIRHDLGQPLANIRFMIGFRAKSLLIAANNQYIYKFPLRHRDYRTMAIREKSIVDALRPISPLYIPSVELIEYRGILIRKYELMPGVGMRGMPREIQTRLHDQLARQIAHFICVIASSDPAEIRHLKPNPQMRPAPGLGWYHWDIYDNFLVDTTSGRITAVIDWEDCRFGDFGALLRSDPRPGVREFMAVVNAEYDKLCAQKA